MSPTTDSDARPGGFDLDVVDWPIVRLRIYGRLRGPLARELTAAVENQVFTRRERYCLIVDARDVGAPSAEVRRHFAEFTARNTAHTRDHCAGEAYVIDSPLVRAALKAMNWFAPYPYPNEVFATVEQAEAWLAALRV